LKKNFILGELNNYEEQQYKKSFYNVNIISLSSPVYFNVKIIIRFWVG